MHRAIAIVILQICSLGNGYRLDFLNTVQCPSGAHRHIQPQGADRLVIHRIVVGEIIGIVDQIQREGIGGRCIA